MDSDTPHEPANLAHSAAAFAVHVFTACGAGCALLALIAAVNAQWAVMFVWLGIALGIDGIDGTFARRLQVAKLLPRWSGDVLDLVVDILNYVFVPAYALAASGLLPKPAAVPLGLLIVVSGALYFADRLMKTSDYYFRGFPALWNVAAFYLFILKPEPWAGAAVIVVLAVLTFVPFHVVHPLRIAHWRGITTVALAAWAVLALAAVAQDLNPPLWIGAALCALAIYFVAIGFFRRHHL
ncbi:MAG TPA: phosphatidylcholine synthase [Xanthobacteraceae bacterium]|jgi:phosphatidylcholine synthase|nr:phosphatidylcholine synthase [Xanthobacteraceae bacterium]